MKPILTLTFDSMDELAKFITGTGIATSVPSAPAPVPASNDDDDGEQNHSAPDVDSAGYPWDERIHAPSKAMNKNGTWRKKQKLDDNFVASVEAEIKSGTQVPVPMQQPAPIQQAMPPMPPVQPVDQAPAPIQQAMPPMPPVDQTPPPVQQPAPPMPPMPSVDQTPPTAQQPAPAPEGMDFHTFMQHLSAQMQKRDGAGQPIVTADYLAKVTGEIATAFNTQLTAITDIASQPNMIAYAVQLFQRDGKWG